MDSFIIVDMYIFIVIAFLWTALIKDQILRYVVYKPYLLLLLFIISHIVINSNNNQPYRQSLPVSQQILYKSMYWY